MKEEQLIERLSQAEAILDLTMDIICSLSNTGHALIDESTGHDELATAHGMLHEFEQTYSTPMEKGSRRRYRVQQFKQRKGIV